MDRSKRFTLFLPWQTYSFRHQLGFSVKHSSHAELRATTKSLTFPPLSIARYSFIQLSQLGRQWRERKCPIFETVAKEDSNPGSLDCESGILPLSYHAPLEWPHSRPIMPAAMCIYKHRRRVGHARITDSGLVDNPSLFDRCYRCLINFCQFPTVPMLLRDKCALCNGQFY